MTIKWVNAKVKISDLKDYENNPRKITKEEFANLVKSLKEDGYHGRLLVNTDNVIIGGHGRRRALLKAGYTENDEIEVLMPDRLLEGEEFDRVNIRDNLVAGTWDSDKLCNLFDTTKLIEWGMPKNWLSGSATEILINDEKENAPHKKQKVCPSCGELL